MAVQSLGDLGPAKYGTFCLPRENFEVTLMQTERFLKYQHLDFLILITSRIPSGTLLRKGG